MRPSPRLVVPVLSVLLCGCDSSPSEAGDGTPEDLRLALRVVAEVGAATSLTTPRGDDRLFVTEQSGAVRIIREGTALPEPFLDLGDRTIADREQGLLGLAFHPDYAENGRFFVNYTDLQGDTRLVEYRADPDDGDRADPASEQELLFLPQPRENHNGGQLAFGPDGMLYMSTGDGGGPYDPEENAQDLSTLHGGILRLDVSTPGTVAAPPDNPLVGDPDGRDELWAWGLRNPWHFSFDPETGTIFIADVGQVSWEELNAAPSEAGGRNYGWPIFEGPECRLEAECDRDDLEAPVATYPHAEGCSVIGGYVYRGEAIPGLQGHYLYSDLCAGWLRSFRYEAGEARDGREWETSVPGQPTSFGVDSSGELHVLVLHGTVYRIEAVEGG